MRAPNVLRPLFASLILFALNPSPAARAAGVFHWLGSGAPADVETVRDLPPPAGYVRANVESEGFADWLRDVPLKPAGTPARRWDGRRSRGQHMVHRVVDIDVGDRDLQQCADSVIRLRAEYLYSTEALDEIAFDFTSGDRSRFSRWAEGFRPHVRNNDVSWRKRAAADASYDSFRDYLDNVFMYAGTWSLAREMERVPGVADIRGGDVYIKGGFPGHVVIVMDVARNPDTGRTAVLLAQGFMPAMDLHVVTNSRDRSMSPWYVVDDRRLLRTPWGVFRPSQLMRFPG